MQPAGALQLCPIWTCNNVQKRFAILSKNFLQFCPKSACKKQNYIYKESNGIKVITSSGIKYVRDNEIKNQPVGYRLAISKTTSEHAKEADKNGQYKVLAKMFVMDPDTVCSQSYMTVHGITSKNSSENLMKTIKSKFFRLLILNRTNGQNIASSAYCDIPLLDFSRSYTDQDLYKMFNLTQEEIDYIEKTIKPME